MALEDNGNIMDLTSSDAITLPVAVAGGTIDVWHGQLAEISGLAATIAPVFIVMWLCVQIVDRLGMMIRRARKG